jgi:uncharacterized ferredoxin-like protein
MERPACAPHFSINIHESLERLLAHASIRRTAREKCAFDCVPSESEGKNAIMLTWHRAAVRDKFFIEVNAAQLRASDLVIFFHTISQKSVSVQCVCCGTRRVAQTATAAAAAALLSCEIALIIIRLRSALNMWSIARISPHTMQKHSARRCTARFSQCALNRSD